MADGTELGISENVNANSTGAVFHKPTPTCPEKATQKVPARSLPTSTLLILEKSWLKAG